MGSFAFLFLILLTAINFIYFSTRYFFFLCSGAFIFYSFLTKAAKLPIFNHIFFSNFFACCSDNYLVTNPIFLSTTVTIILAKCTCLPSCLDLVTESTKSFIFELNFVRSLEFRMIRILVSLQYDWSIWKCDPMYTSSIAHHLVKQPSNLG